MDGFVRTTTEDAAIWPEGAPRSKADAERKLAGYAHAREDRDPLADFHV